MSLSDAAFAAGLAPLPLDRAVAQDRELYAKLRIQERFGITFHPYASICRAGGPGTVRCLAKVITDEMGMPLSLDRGSGMAGYGPKEFRAAYNVSGVARGHPVIGIVDAFAYPRVHHDLKVYSRQFKLPILPKCEGAVASSPVPCIQVVNEKGGKRLPKTVDAGWASEQAIDVQLAHAICENCSILLVEADTDGDGDLFPSINTAAKLGANAISNSWAEPESPADPGTDHSYLTHPGVVITAGTGDHGYAEGVLYPASSPNVVGVGGTSLFLKHGKKYDSEIAWSGAGSGCSQFEPRSSWQPSLSGCPNNRTVSDIAVDADPITGAAIYDSQPETCSGTTNCWFQFGGTSISSPIVAAMFALSGGVPPNTTQPASILYANASERNSRDVTSGTTGTCGFAYLCNAVPGYDGPTGLGSPKGLSIFIEK